MNSTKTELDKMRQEIIDLAVERGIITKKEIPTYIGEYIDEYGIDSFINYLSALLGEPKMDAFCTLCKPLLKDKDKIEKKFGLKIITLRGIQSW